MTRRRELLVGIGAGALATLAGSLPAWASPAGKLRVASLKLGSLAWLLQTMRAEGLDKAADLEIEIIDVATNQAGPVALLAGEADIIVSDWTWAMRQRSMGEALVFAPYSSALGALMVSRDSGVRSISDLAGKRLGVAGSAIDKSWLLLRAYSRRTTGKDVAEIASPIFGAAPLVSEELRNGRLDAVLTFWTFAARLKGAGFETVLSVDDMMKGLGVAPPPPLVGFVWRERTGAEKGQEIAAFLGAVEAANRVLATSEVAWERLKPLVKPASEGELAAIKAGYRAGIPGRWSEAETRSAEKLMALLMAEGGTELVGSGTRFDQKLFHGAGN
ncbi:MAG: ABC transporter substrate-binding protein [Pseudomonadota bacterium]